MSYTRVYTPAERAAWEAAQDPTKLPALDMARIAAARRWQAEKRRIEAVQASRVASRVAKKG